MLAAPRLVAEGPETDAQVLVVPPALGLDRVDAVARGAAFVVVREPASQFLDLFFEHLGAGVGVEEVAVGELELGVAFVEALAGVDDVVDALEVALGEVGAREGDEAGDEEVVEVREGFHVGGEGVGGKGDALRIWELVWLLWCRELGS